MKRPAAGFREIEHTADWELKVWAPDLPGLLEQAARGMYALLAAQLQPGPRLELQLDLQSIDREALLVSFLNELLFLGEEEGLGFDKFDLNIADNHLHAQLEGAPLAALSKEIKSVTYHNLAVRETGLGLETNLVFDV